MVCDSGIWGSQNVYLDFISAFKSKFWELNETTQAKFAHISRELNETIQGNCSNTN